MEKEIKILKKLLPKSLADKLPAKIAVVKISDTDSRFFNRKYRHKDKPANVLSFYYSSDYGEILICPKIVLKQAKKDGNPFKYQMTWMILHGMLHLAGLHHEKSVSAAEKTAKLENKILKKIFVH